VVDRPRRPRRLARRTTGDSSAEATDCTKAEQAWDSFYRATGAAAALADLALRDLTRESNQATVQIGASSVMQSEG